MSFLKRLAVLFFVIFNMFVASILILYVLNIFDYHNAEVFLRLVYTDDTLKFIFIIFSGVVLFINFVFYRVFSVNIRRDKTIAFDNPNGRVTVSLVALEDLIKRTTQGMLDIKDAKSNIVVSKKGLHVTLRLSILSDVSIPAMISEVQDLVKSKIQDTIGLEEKLDINVYVVKIVTQVAFDGKKKKKESKKNVEKKKEAVETPIPFQGYRVPTEEKKTY